jgi:hypothetical protein
VTIADADFLVAVLHLNIRIHLGTRLPVPCVENMPFAQVLDWSSLKLLSITSQRTH